MNRLVKFDCTSVGTEVYVNPDLVSHIYQNYQNYPGHTTIMFVHGGQGMTIYENTSEVAKKLKYSDDE